MRVSTDWFSAAEGRPPAGVGKVSQLLNSTDTAQRDAGMLVFLHPRPALSHAGRAGYWSSFSSSWSPSPIEDAWLSGDRPGQGLSTLPASRLEHRLHLAPTTESLKTTEALHDLPIAALCQARFCQSEGNGKVATGEAEDPSRRPGRGLFRAIDKLPPAQKAELPMLDPERTSPDVSLLAFGEPRVS